MRIGLFFRTTSIVAALSASASGCVNDAPAARSANPNALNEPTPQGNASCVIRGSQMLYPGTTIWSTVDRKVSIAQSGGDVMHFEITSLPDKQDGRSSVTLRTASAGPSFVIFGAVELRDLSVYTKRDLPIVPNHAWVAKDSQVEVARDGEAKSRAFVHASFGAFRSLAAVAPCDALSLDKPKDAPINREDKPDSYAHLAHAGTTLKDVSGTFLLALGRDGEAATVRVLESKGSLRHILYDDGVRLDAWVDADAIASGEGPDCDDCHGGIRDTNDRCPEYPDDDSDGCPETPLVIGTAQSDLDIHNSLEEKSLIVGRLERGAEVLVVDDPAKANPIWARVRPRRVQLSPVTKDFLVARSGLSTRS